MKNQPVLHREKIADPKRGKDYRPNPFFDEYIYRREDIRKRLVREEKRHSTTMANILKDMATVTFGSRGTRVKS